MSTHPEETRDTSLSWHYPGLGAHSPLRIRRRVSDLSASEEFWARGLGLTVLTSEPARIILGFPAAPWCLELTHTPADALTDTPADALVLTTGSVLAEDTLARLQATGGELVENAAGEHPHATTLRDPDGYLLVLAPRPD